MSITLEINLTVLMSNQIHYELEKLSKHEISKFEAQRNIMEHVEKTFLKMNVKIEKP